MEKLNAKFVPIDDLLQQSDFVVVCCALTPSTEGMFNLEAFKKMKRDAIFINSSRYAMIYSLSNFVHLFFLIYYIV